MKSAIISVGTELLFGQVVNTNAAYLSQELNNLGIDVMYHYTMGDNPVRLKRLLEFAFEDCDLLVCTGGLGPTEDDLTKETVCEYMGEKLVLNEEALASMESYFNKIRLGFTENNRKQANMPEHGVVFQNGAGTAPGFAVEKNGKTIICMPGVPREMKHMYENSVKPYLESKSDAVIFSKSIRVFGIGESMVETMLLPFIDGQTDPTIATYAKEGIVEVRVTSKRRTEAEAAAAVEEMSEGILEILGNNVASTEGKELYEEVASKLLARDISISCCESATAGIFAAELAKVPGISKVFDRGIVAYSTKAKIEELGVPAEVIKEYTPFSMETAEAMVKGLKELSESRLCIACTGLAGPEGYGEKGAGEYYISVIFDGEMTSQKFVHKGRTRQLNRDFMTLTMFNMINQIVDGKEMTQMQW